MGQSGASQDNLPSGPTSQVSAGKVGLGRSVARTQAQQDLVLAALRRAWAHEPHQRLTQLVVNATNRNDPFYVEDDDLMAALDNYDPIGPE